MLILSMSILKEKKMVIKAALTVSEIASRNPASGGNIRRRHANEMLRQGKARSGGSYFHSGMEIGRLLMNNILYTYVKSNDKELVI